MIKKIDITDPAHAERVLQIQLLSYQIEAEIIGNEDLPPLKESAADLQHSGEMFYGYYVGEDLGGVVSFKMDQQEVDIHRLIVSPAYFRQGIAQNF
ncbi:GNAT family N-acetyltransferase [Jeotgalibacillus terrae]|uniref:GNAT family N-acetyltransferase n=1 Tax=Jeotgalibacillus terrae TaxID=587735 RepID=A0ABW5ZGZ4_9BACL|nr:GNAT family N-acetyltransferase [Jeotgalibacillus terrae]MBM7578654.1 ribosomal protein S18 acetylase RimI-like enzyme [Jeotgalibacillus terrae]